MNVTIVVNAPTSGTLTNTASATSVTTDPNVNNNSDSEDTTVAPCSLALKFHQTSLQNGTTYYTDRGYTFTNVPSHYIGLDMIRTLNDERNNTCGSGYMRFTLVQDAKVFVAYDRRATNLPDWLNGFTDTGDIIDTSLSSQGWLKVYSKQLLCQ